MEIEAFRPKVSKDHRFAVAVPTELKTMVIIETYGTLDELKAGYQQWKEQASSRGITNPYPIELLDSSGECKIISDPLS